MQDRLKQLREAVGAIEHRGRTGRDRPGVPTQASGDNLPMPPGVHEWFGFADAPRWIPPLGILMAVLSKSLFVGYSSDSLSGAAAARTRRSYSSIIRIVAGWSSPSVRRAISIAFS